MKWPTFGSKLADLPNDLDENAQERLDYFVSAAKQSELVSISKLLWLAVMVAPDVDFGAGPRFKNSGATVSLNPHTMVLTAQNSVGAKKVAFYIEQFRAGGEPGKIRVTDSTPRGCPSGWWHLDGLHRLLAARILGMDVTVELWRPRGDF